MEKLNTENQAQTRKRIKLTDLPNELLLVILARIPDFNLHLQVSLVCSRLECLSSVAYAQRRSLSIFCGLENCQAKDIYQPGEIKIIKFVNLTAEKCRKFVQIYPKVCSLSVYLKVDRLDCTPQLELALTDALLDNDHWCVGQLKSFSLTISVYIPEEEDEVIDENLGKSIRRIISLINHRMISLRKLKIDMSISLGSEPLDMPIIGQLEHFSFETNDGTDLIYASLIKYGACEASPLKRINLSTMIQTEDRMANLIMNLGTSPVNRLHISDDNFNNQLSLFSKMTYLNLFCSPLSELERLGEFFLPRVLFNLNKITIYWRIRDPLVHLIRALGPLTHDVAQSKLDELNILFRTDNPEFLDHSALDLSELVELEGATSPLLSIRFVYVELPIKLRSHDEVRQLQLDLICPNVRRVAFDVLYDQCKLCEDEHIDRDKCEYWMVERCWDMRPRPTVVFNDEEH